MGGGGTDGVSGTATGRRRSWTSENESVLGRVDQGSGQSELVAQSDYLDLRSTTVVTVDCLHVRQPLPYVCTQQRTPTSFSDPGRALS